MSEHIPAVSVVMAAYNAEKYLRASIESILGQTFRDFEFVIVDDGSHDGTWDIVQEYARRDARIVPVRNDGNLRLPRSLNRGLELSRAPLIARQDADDVSLPDRLERQVAYLENHAEVAVLGTWMETFNDQRGKTGVYEVPREHSLIAWTLYWGRAFAHPTVMLRREAILQVGGYDARCLHAEDVDLWTRMAYSSRFANLPDVLYRYRVASSSICRAHRVEQLHQVLLIRRRFAERALGRRVPLKVLEWQRDATIGLHRLRENERKAAGDLARELCQAMMQAGCFVSDEVPLVEADLQQRLDVLNKPQRKGFESCLRSLLRRFTPHLVRAAFFRLRHPEVLALEWRERRRRKVGRQGSRPGGPAVPGGGSSDFARPAMDGEPCPPLCRLRRRPG